MSKDWFTPNTLVLDERFHALLKRSSQHPPLRPTQQISVGSRLPQFHVLLKLPMLPGHGMQRQSSRNLWEARTFGFTIASANAKSNAGHRTLSKFSSRNGKSDMDSIESILLRKPDTVKQKQIRRGVKEVQKFVNKGEKGIMVLAGDTLPIEVYCHLPVMCEDRNLPYVYIPSKTDLGAAAGSKRPTCVIMVKPHEDYQEAYDECLEEVQALPPPL
ncbi:H/ACA ribonucleoprotein complex subunit 2 [Tupaia chinensis]|uniref:H/ACA ribonucleoprotein complex subunit 2 n=1 Tax=Tupaia chinensis TaxID=246437 RepID=L9JBK7_TUPCH|nr:H/ACA ribonucleoprotein complex subunit 2 [Tupaia chinensis]